MSSLLSKSCVCSSAFQPARRGSRRALVVAASSDMSRRAAGLAVASAPLAFLAVAPAARALILDEEDEELLNKAKANRKSKLAADKLIEREFLQDEGLKNRNLDKELVPVQKAIYSMAKSGSQIEAGDLRAAASTLSEGWVVDLQRNAKALSTSADVAPVIDAIKKTQAAASKNDAKGTRQAFVAMTGSVQSYVNAAGVASFLKGL